MYIWTLGSPLLCLDTCCFSFKMMPQVEAARKKSNNERMFPCLRMLFIMLNFDSIIMKMREGEARGRARWGRTWKLSLKFDPRLCRCYRMECFSFFWGVVVINCCWTFHNREIISGGELVIWNWMLSLLIKEERLITSKIDCSQYYTSRMILNQF